MRKIVTTLVLTILLGSQLISSARVIDDKSNEALIELGGKAVAIIKTKRKESLNNYLMVYCKAANWKSLEKDGDLGPFLKFKAKTKDMDAIVVLPETLGADSTYCIYFNANRAIGLVQIKIGKGEKLTNDAVAKGYSEGDFLNEIKSVNIKGQIGTINSDDNKPIPSIKIVDDGSGKP